MPVYRGEMDARQYLDQESADRPNRAAALEEMLILHITNQNPAVQSYKELFDEEPLKNSSPYEQTVRVLKEFFKRQPGFGNPGRESRESRVFDRSLAGTGTCRTALAFCPIGIPPQPLGRSPGRGFCAEDTARHGLRQGRCHTRQLRRRFCRERFRADLYGSRLYRIRALQPR